MRPAIDGSRQAASNRRRADVGRPGHVALPREDRLVVDRLEAEPPDLLRRRDRTRRGRTGWRERRRRGDRRARARAVCASQEARHLVGDRAMLVAAERLRAAPVPPSGRARDAGARGSAPSRAAAASARPRRARTAGAPSSTAWTSASSAAACVVVIAAADQHAVAAGLDRQHRGRPAPRTSSAIAFISRSSLRITPSKPQLVAQQPVTIRLRQRRRPLLVERRHEHVRRHDRRDAGVDRRLERHELDRAQPIGRMLDERQLEMRIGAACRRARENACRTPRRPRPAARG